MKKIVVLIILLLLAVGMQAQVSLNTVGFESGNINAWSQFTGTCCPVNVTAGAVQGQLTNGVGFDTYGGFPVVCPGAGNYSFKLGDSSGTNKSEIIRYTFTVDTFNYNLQFKYAAVLKNGGVAPNDDSRFYMRILNNLGNEVFTTAQCAACQFTPGVSGFTQSAIDPSVYYLPWTDQFINLHHYKGQTITIELVASDANAGSSNFGYGYFDLVQSGTLAPAELYCAGATQFSLGLPNGSFAAQSWYDQSFNFLSSGYNVSFAVSSQAPGDSVYLVIQPTPGQGINDTILYSIKLFPHPYPQTNFNWNHICTGTPIQFTDISNSTEPIASYQWAFGDAASGSANSSAIQNPTHSYSNISLVTVTEIVSTIFGCVDTAQNVISLALPPIALAGSDTFACYNQPIILGTNPSTIGGSGNFTFGWSLNNVNGSLSNAQIAQPVGLFTGNAILTFTITDNITNCIASDNIVFSLNTNCVNTAPIANADYRTLGNNQTIVVAVLANDQDADGNLTPQGNISTASIQILTAPLYGSATLIGNAIQYNGNAAYIGYDTLVYVLHDNGTPDLTDTANVYLNLLPALQANAGSNQTLCNGAIGIVTAPVASGGSGAYTYNWSPASGLSCTNCANPIISASSTSTYQLIVIDNATLQQDTSSIQIVIGNAVVNLGNDTALNFLNNGIQLQAVYNGNSTAVGYAWTPNVACGGCSNPLVFPIGTTNYVVTVTDANGCLATDTIIVYACSTDCIWPGDADQNHVANFSDLLTIGLGYGYTGPIRFNPTTNWVGQPGLDWSTSTINNLNFKYADCNADGIINGLDTTILLNNYDSTHAKLGPPKSGSASISVEFNTTTAQNGSHIYADVVLGSAAVPVDSVYGVAFTFLYDTMVVNTATAALHRYNSNWICTPFTDGMDMIRYPEKGIINYAITRINHLNKSGNGPIARVDMDIQTGNIAGRVNQQYFYNLIASVKGVVVLDRLGDTIAVNSKPDTCVIDYYKVGIPNMPKSYKVNCIPNPASSFVSIRTTESVKLESIRLFDIAGRKLITATPKFGVETYDLNLENIQAGTYLLEVVTNQGTTTHSLVVQR